MKANLNSDGGRQYEWHQTDKKSISGIRLEDDRVPDRKPTLLLTTTEEVSTKKSVRGHLAQYIISVAHAEQLIECLQHFVRTGKLPITQEEYSAYESN